MCTISSVVGICEIVTSRCIKTEITVGAIVDLIAEIAVLGIRYVGWAGGMESGEFIKFF